MGRTLAGRLRDRASSHESDRIALRCRSGTQWRERTWSQYWEGALRSAGGLREHGVGPGSRVLVLATEVEAAILTLFGAWALGAVPIQVGLPFRLNDVPGFIAHLSETARRFGARALVVSRSLAPWAAAYPAGVVLVAEDLVDHAVDDREVDPDAFIDATALIQLTSGSTAHPRGVVVSHDRLVRHMDCMSRALPSHADSVAVSWLPLHHDMGLVGGLLFPFFNGFVANMLSPADFRGGPMVWLEAMSEFRGTITAAPPSAYAMLLRIARRAIDKGLDLSSWECAMVGAEPISADLLRRLSAALAPAGFRAEAMFPVYGLAEATVAVTFPKLLAATRVDRIDRAVLERDGRAIPVSEPALVMELVGVGRPIPETEVRIVSLTGETLPDRVVGEIQARSTTLMRGYHEDPEATARTLADGWLRTGDLGYLADGELFVTGRIKDVIIRGGLNVLPTAIEEVAGSVEGARAGGVAAVGVRDADVETEVAWLLVETKLEDGALRAQLRARLDAALKVRGMVVDRIELLEPGALPKTTSGKLRRRDIATAIGAGSLPFVR